LFLLRFTTLTGHWKKRSRAAPLQLIWCSHTPDEKNRMGFARLFRPTYAGANMGHPDWFRLTWTRVPSHPDWFRFTLTDRDWTY
jgi:hypothetical protein